MGKWNGCRCVFKAIFNNFSTSGFLNHHLGNLFLLGDGKKIRLRAASNGSYYQNYSVSFEDPWMGGKKPNSFSISLVGKQFNLNEGSRMTFLELALD